MDNMENIKYFLERYSKLMRAKKGDNAAFLFIALSKNAYPIKMEVSSIVAMTHFWRVAKNDKLLLLRMQRAAERIKDRVWMLYPAVNTEIAAFRFISQYTRYLTKDVRERWHIDKLLLRALLNQNDPIAPKRFSWIMTENAELARKLAEEKKHKLLFHIYDMFAESHILIFRGVGENGMTNAARVFVPLPSSTVRWLY